MHSVVVIKDTRMWSTAIDLLPGGRVVGVSFTVLRHLRSPSGILHSWWVWLMAEFCRMGNAGLMAGYLIRCPGGCLSLVSAIPRARLNLSWCSVWLIEGFARLLSFPFPLLRALILLDLYWRLQNSTFAIFLRLSLLRFVPFSFGISRFLCWVRGGCSARGSVVLCGGTLQSYLNGRFPALLTEANLSCCFRCLQGVWCFGEALFATVSRTVVPFSRVLLSHCSEK